MSFKTNHLADFNFHYLASINIISNHRKIHTFTIMRRQDLFVKFYGQRERNRLEMMSISRLSYLPYSENDKPLTFLLSKLFGILGLPFAAILFEYHTLKCKENVDIPWSLLTLVLVFRGLKILVFSMNKDLFFFEKGRFRYTDSIGWAIIPTVKGGNCYRLMA